MKIYLCTFLFVCSEAVSVTVCVLLSIKHILLCWNPVLYLVGIFPLLTHPLSLFHFAVLLLPFRGRCFGYVKPSCQGCCYPILSEYEGTANEQGHGVEQKE